MKSHLKALAIVLATTGCSSSGNDYGDFFKVLGQNGFRRTSISLNDAAAIPFATLGWRLNGGDENLIVLATDHGGDQLWTSANHVVILTQNGRIKRTVGMPHDLGAMAPRGNDRLTSPSQALRAPYSQTRLLDFPDIGAYDVTVACQGHTIGAQTIRILGKPIRTVRVEERCESNNPKWLFRNLFWVDADSGLVWRSIQQIHPTSETIETETLRPPT